MGKFLGNLGNAFGGIFFGLILFLASFVVVFQNEGSVNYRDVAERAIPAATATKPDDFVYMTDRVLSDERISDGEFIRDDNFIFLGRNVEMYAWEEKKETMKNTQTSEEEVRYTYARNWTTNPTDSGSFHDTTYINPTLSLSQKDVRVNEARVGELGINMSQIQLAPSRSVSLTSDKLAPTATGALMDNYIYVGSGSLLGPEIGDIRISFSALLAGTQVTVFGKKAGDMLLAHHDKDKTPLYRMFQGDLNDAFAVLQNEYTFSLWMWRAIGFFMMWFGILLVLKPIMMIFDLVPVLGKFTNSAITFVSFLIALIVTTVVSLVSIVLHNIFALIIIGILALVGAYFLFFKKNPHDELKKPTASTPRTTSDVESKQTPKTKE